MKFLHTAIILILSLSMTGCERPYDDSSLWNSVDNLYKQMVEIQKKVTSLNHQMSLLSRIVYGGALTGITVNSEGHYVVSYRDADNVEHTVMIATTGDVVAEPLIGVGQENGIYYWTLTLSGNTTWMVDEEGRKIPITGRVPELTIDHQGYLMVDGKRVTDSEGHPVKAQTLDYTLVTSIGYDTDGNALFTLGDGTILTLQVNSAFNIFFDTDTISYVEDVSTPLVIHYNIVGESADKAMIQIVRTQYVTAELDKTQKTITVSFPEDFYEGSISVMVYDASDNVVVKPLFFTVEENEHKGIQDAADLVAFVRAVNEGKSVARWTNKEGVVFLAGDIDLFGVSSWNPAGKVIPGTTNPNSAVSYTVENPFSGVFDGKGHTIRNISWTFDVSDGNQAYGLFGALQGAVIRNLTIGSSDDASRIVLTGKASQGTLAGALAGYSENSILENCVNYTDIHFAGEDDVNITVHIGGLTGHLNGGVIGGSDNVACYNYGNITCGPIQNTGNGTNSGMHVGGITGFIANDPNTRLAYCINRGEISAPSGRGGGITAVALGGTIEYCTNDGLIQDDIDGVFSNHASPYNLKRMGGLVGGATSAVLIRESVNNGNVFSQLGCRTGGFVGHNEAAIVNCINTGAILSDHITVGSAYHGSGWVCGYNRSADLIAGCLPGGFVGDYSEFRLDPKAAPPANYSNAVCHGAFDPEINGLSEADDAFYDWTLVSERTLHEGVNYYHYSFTNIAQHIYVIEADLNNPKVEITTVISDDTVPNPNLIGINNGKKERETLSETCERRIAEGQNIIAGINTGFFDTTHGIPRGFHIEEGRPDFINNPDVRSRLTNHAPGFTFFKDRSLGFGRRSFEGFIKIGEESYEYYSINDTIVINTCANYQTNLYTARLKQNPHEGVSVNVSSEALFLTGRNDQVLQVNEGWFTATLTDIVDGRNGASVTVPYVNDNRDWVLQVTGETADLIKDRVSKGDQVQIRADVFLDGDRSTGPILTQNASMYRFLYNGSFSRPASTDEPYPATLAGADETNTKVYWIAIDGRSSASRGLTFYQAYRVGKKLGCYNLIRFDGGGSTTMWVRDEGGVVNVPSDTGGERSCMNYFHLRIKN